MIEWYFLTMNKCFFNDHDIIINIHFIILRIFLCSFWLFVYVEFTITFTCVFYQHNSYKSREKHDLVWKSVKIVNFWPFVRNGNHIESGMWICRTEKKVLSWSLHITFIRKSTFFSFFTFTVNIVLAFISLGGFLNILIQKGIENVRFVFVQNM